MTTYILPADETGLQVRLGWDNPMMTFFGQVLRPSRRVDEDDEILVWIGASAREVLTVDALQSALAEHREIPADVVASLRRDRIAALDRGPTLLQRQMQAHFDEMLRSVPYDGFACGFHVFGREPRGEWFHHMTVQTEIAAEDEASGLLQGGCKAQIVAGPVSLVTILDKLNEGNRRI